jgi:oligoendopeptidase F
MKADMQKDLQTHWNLADLFRAPDCPEMEAAFSELENMTTEFEALRPQLTANTSIPVFMEFLKKLDRIKYLGMKLEGYAYLLFSEDTQDQSAAGLIARVQQFLAELSNRILFFDLWWKALEDDYAKNLMEASGNYHYWLESMRSFKPFTLGEREEKIINIKNVTGSHALNILYDTMTNRYTFKINVNGEEKNLTRGEIMFYVRHEESGLRAASYHEQNCVYGNDGLILGQIYQALVRDWRNEYVNLRKYPSPISVRNLANSIPDEVVDIMLEVARKNAGIFQRFFRLKARRLGVDRLHRYDIYAPLAGSDRVYPFEEGVAKVLDIFRQFDPQFEKLAERVFREGHLDSEARKGKSCLPFCSFPTHDHTPFINIHYQGRTIDVSTLAHELGHAVHGMLASGNTTVTARTCLPLAETASIFSEMLLVDNLLKSETNEEVRRDLLFGQVEHTYTAIERQAFTATFECQAHQMVHEGASVDALAAAYLELLKVQFGGSVEVSDDYRWEWVSIPHIFNVPFYVYAYSFGELLVLAL